MYEQEKYLTGLLLVKIQHFAHRYVEVSSRFNSLSTANHTYSEFVNIANNLENGLLPPKPSASPNTVDCAPVVGVRKANTAGTNKSTRDI